MSTRKTIILAVLLVGIVIAGEKIVAPSAFNIGRSADLNRAADLPQSGLARFFNDPLSILSRLQRGSENGLPTARASNQITIPTKGAADLPQNVRDVRLRILKEPAANIKGDILLAKSDNWTIEYIPTPDYFHVTILKDPADTAKKEAERWFLEFGLQQHELCDLPVRFILATEELKKQNFTFSNLPNGCE